MDEFLLSPWEQLTNALEAFLKHVHQSAENGTSGLRHLSWLL